MSAEFRTFLIAAMLFGIGAVLDFLAGALGETGSAHARGAAPDASRVRDLGASGHAHTAHSFYSTALMRPRRFLLLPLLLLACQQPTDTPPRAPRQAGPLPARTANDLPNIVVILTDDMRAELLSFMPIVKRQLVDSGTTFTKAFVNSPLCCPSRASLLTGWMQHTTQVLGNGAPHGGAPAFQDAVTVATDLKAAGYTTALMGKYLNGYNLLGTNYVPPGWDEWRAYQAVRYTDAKFVEKAFDSAAVYTKKHTGYANGTLRTRLVSFLQRAPADRPVFLLYVPYAPHREAALNTYPIPATQDVGRCATTPLPAMSPSVNEADVSDKPAFVQSAALLTAAKLARADSGRRKQCEALFAVDRAVGDIIATLGSTGRLDNTLIVFATDNGYLFGEHRLLERKAAMYDEAILTPLVIRGLGARMAAVDTNLVQSIDLTATIRAVAGLVPNAAGRDLRPTATDGVFTTDALLIEMTNAAIPKESFSMVRTHQYAYAVYPAGGPGGTPFVELYDLQIDPFELQNVASHPAYAGTVATLHARLLQLQQLP